MAPKDQRMTYASEGDVRLDEVRDFINACPAPPHATVELKVQDRGGRLPNQWWVSVQWPRI